MPLHVEVLGVFLQGTSTDIIIMLYNYQNQSFCFSWNNLFMGQAATEVSLLQYETGVVVAPTR